MARAKATTTGNRAAIYRRVSTTKQSTEDHYSLPDQLERCTNHANDLGYQVVRDFCEVHTGAELDQRPEMSALREAVRRHEIDIVVITKLDRLARNQIHQSVLLYEFDKYGVQLSLVDENYDDTPAGRFMRSTKGFMSELERETIRERMTNGRRKRVRDGKMVPGWLPLYGYQWVDERKTAYEIDPVTAPIVCRIFADVAAGKPIRRIALELTEEGIPTPKDRWRRQRNDPSNPPQGKRWAKSTLWNLLNHPAYCGQHSAFRYERVKRDEVDSATGRVVTVNEQRERTLGEQRVLLEHAAPPLITPEIAEAVKRRLAHNQLASARNNKHPEIALLRGGLAKCGLCGGSMIVTIASQRRGKPAIPIYRCYHSHTSGAESSCQGTTITIAKMDAAVWARVMDVLKNPRILMEEAEKRMSDSGKQHTIEGYKATIASLEAQEATLAEAIGLLGQQKSKYGMESLLAQLQSVGEKRTEAQARLKKAETEYRSWLEVQRRLHDLEAWCRGITRGAEELTYEEKRIVLFGLNTRVMVYPHDHTPRYRILMGNEDAAVVSGDMEDESDEIMSQTVFPSGQPLSLRIFPLIMGVCILGGGMSATRSWRLRRLVTPAGVHPDAPTAQGAPVCCYMLRAMACAASHSRASSV